ncbi:DUF883 family protein [Granulosicoccus sp. 3-233]|uniref:DUF883 family protein n=1 Tax=Granulosicoccus sp. 3-233 TaxID=3417969 RepID=UPI003D33BEEA
MSQTVTKPEELKQAARDAIDTAEEKAFDTLEKAREKAEDVVDRAHELEAELQDSVAELSGTVTRYINEKPVQAAGIAFAAGVLATLLIKRR